MKIVEEKWSLLVIHVGIIVHIAYIQSMLILSLGDRAQSCHGLLVPIGIETNKKGYIIIFKCKKCGEIRKNKVAEDDDMNKIIELSARH